MIVVTGSIKARPETLARLIEISLEHVSRSRGEEGCLSHGVAVDVEDANTLVFFERWRDMEAIRRYFAQEASRAFVREAARLAAAAPELKVYEAAEISAAG